ncbi:SH3 domain-containing protein [Rhizophagus clarus]|uniref:SH3 domain-containing protein n=1 Tax=Rhizophagus clarus TaxID=94130 RepID=A0A8H3QJK6_9GLOM|nr:SH3 domain-containing protein [Rhizophagus clarus]
MKPESPTKLDIGIQQKQYIDTPKDVTKNNKNVKNTTAVNLIDEKVEVQPMVITNGAEIKTAAVTNGNDQNSIDSSNNNNSNKNNINNINNNNKSNNINNVHSNSNEELDDMPNKELLSKISETLAEFYGGGKDHDETEGAQKNWPNSNAKVFDGTLTKEGEDIINNMSPEIKIRDFAFPTDDPRHWGQEIPEEEVEEEEEEEDIEYLNRRARALYDFPAENSSELSFQEGDILFVQCQKYEGWFMANLGEETGLIPVNYVKILGDDEDDEDEYGNWAEEGNNNE